jgi:hypothetical protein
MSDQIQKTKKEYEYDRLTQLCKYAIGVNVGDVVA